MNHRHKVLTGVVAAVGLALVMALFTAGEQVSLAAGSIIYVDADATGAHNGTSWADAFTDLQPALDAAVSGDQIWVAEGTYLPTHEFTPGNPRSVSFQMKNGVAIYGGFTGVETSLSERDWVINLTILSCDLSGDDGPDFTNNAENCYHVFYHPDGTNLDNSAILDGFTISGGNANGIFPNNLGGGMLNYASSPTLINCTFRNNQSYLGGGMYNREAASPTLTNCTFMNNQADEYGGGMYNRDSSSPTLFDCIFFGNHAEIAGGGMTNDNCSPTLTNCTFSSNSSIEGGGMYNILYASPIMKNCIFWQNSADVGGGIRNGYYSSPKLTNCTFWGNVATDNGGGIYSDSGVTSIVNSILWDDTPNEIHASSAIITYSDVQGGYSGEGNIDINPLFLDSDNGNFHLSLNSPCIDVGDNEALNLPLYDFEGDDRIWDGDSNGVATVDMGVDEAKLYRVYLPMILRWPDW
jgi:parallel beta-helix repeat protein/predicted outer membrane repeat protein